MLQSGRRVGKAEVMSEANVGRSSELFNVPGLQRNHGDGRGEDMVGRSVKRNRIDGSGWVLRGGAFSLRGI